MILMYSAVAFLSIRDFSSWSIDFLDLDGNQTAKLKRPNQAKTLKNRYFYFGFSICP